MIRTGRIALGTVLVGALLLVAAPLPAMAWHEGCDHWQADSGYHYVWGTSSDNHCHGNNVSSPADWLEGLDGSDDLSGREGDDQMSGGNGHDLLNGDGGGDWITGGNGNDRLRGSGGWDDLDERISTDDWDKVCDGTGSDVIKIDDGDGLDIWYAETTGDLFYKNQYDQISYAGCPIPTS